MGVNIKVCKLCEASFVETRPESERTDHCKACSHTVGKLKHREYNGKMKPCPFCGSNEVVYFVLGVYGRLGCKTCDRWLRKLSEVMYEEEGLDTEL